MHLRARGGYQTKLSTLEDVRANLANRLGGLKVRLCLCEKRKDAVEQLYRYADQHPGIEIHVFHGAFEDHLADIAAICRKGFTFTFIDPTGWNVRSEPIFRFLRDQKGEFLLNFMAEHVNRHAEYQRVAESFGRFLAEPGWEQDFNNLPANWSNEERVLFLLKRKIKELGAASYVPDFPILKPKENRVKMRLLLGTHNVKGLEVFRDVQFRVERAEIKTRNRVRNADNQQVGLLSEDYIAAMQQDTAGVGCLRYRQEAAERICFMLAKTGDKTFQEVEIDVLQNIQIKVTQLKDLVKVMKVNGTIDFTLPPNRRVPQPETLLSLTNPQH
jgi:three-Cys-motif partner protein